MLIRSSLAGFILLVLILSAFADIGQNIGGGIGFDFDRGVSGTHVANKKAAPGTPSALVLLIP